MKLQAEGLIDTIPEKPNSTTWQKSSAGTRLLFTPRFSFLGDVAPFQLWSCSFFPVLPCLTSSLKSLIFLFLSALVGRVR